MLNTLGIRLSTRGSGSRSLWGLSLLKDERLKDERLKDERLKDERLKDERLRCGVTGEVVRSWTVKEFFGDARPPTDDDVPIALDGRHLDTPEKVIAYLDEINAKRTAAKHGA